ncbi:MAG: hypothetical protein ACI4V7_09520 [Succinivibrionaceae bacterium]
MQRQMTSKEVRYVNIVNRSRQINLSPIIARFANVKRKLTAAQIRICLINGAYVYAIGDNGQKTQLNLSNYNILNIPDPVKEENKKEIVKESPVVETQPEAPDIDDETLVQ